MTPDRRILEGIEICRPGSEDLSAPELKDVASRLESDSVLQQRYRNVKAFDEAVRQVVTEVPVPEGLEQRLQDSLPQPVLAAMAADDDEATNPDAAPVSIDAALQSGKRTRRDWLSGRMRLISGLAAAACLMIAAGIIYSQLGGEPWTEQRLEHEVVAWNQMIDDGDWEEAAALPGSMALPDEIQLPLVRWRRLRQPSEGIGNVVVYDLTGPHSGGEVPNCVLFVTQVDIPKLGRTPPLRPTVTQGRLVAIWRSGEKVVCVLVLRNASQPVLRDHYKVWFTSGIGSA